ncbi:hypothetical protein [Priestia koreensis]|uniref:hypothetical protein n=1 Tax=Priestia koreensis TaxID=284581 RepID=UPI00203C4FD5|nr:hypothetical protein [Priestia koreensis]MCM3002922.1 hypothetical protein [Priestia koreensis]
MALSFIYKEQGDSMNLFKSTYIISLNFTAVFCTLVTILFVIIFFRFAVYFLSPNKYIQIENEFAKVLYQKISKKKNSEGNKKKVSVIEKIPEKFIFVVASIYLLFKNLTIKLTYPFLLILFFYVWFEFVELDVYNTVNIYGVLKIYNPSDQFTYNILNAVINIIKLIAPLSLPFYYFTYREQKNIADSSINGNSINSLFVVFLLFAASTLIYSMNILEAFESENNGNSKDSLSLTENYGDDLALIALYGFSAFLFLIKLIYDLLNSISLKKLLKKRINKVYFHYYLMSFGEVLIFKKFQYEYLSSQVETIYQGLNLAAEKNLGKVYGDNFKEWSKVLDYMLIEYRFGSLDTTTKHLHLLKKYKNNHITLYKTILKNHKTLIMTLVKEHKIEDSKEAINKLLDWIPSPTQLFEQKSNDDCYDEYLSIYYVTLYELLIYLYDNKNVGVYPVMEKLSGESETIETTEQEGIIRNIHSLIIRAIENNDVKMLSLFTYSLVEQFKELNSYKSHSEEYEITLEYEMFTVKEVDDEKESEEFNKSNSKNNDLLNGSIFLLLQALLKSIEYTHYKTTGFLVKFLVTNFNSEVFKSVFNDFNTNPYENTYLLKNKYYKDIEDNFHFNNKSKEYIFIKLFILVYAQQKYIIRNNVNFGEIPKELLDPTILTQRDYLDYVFNKLNTSKKEYGLLFLEEEKFISEIKSDFGVEVEKSSSMAKRIGKLFRNNPV